MHRIAAALVVGVVVLGGSVATAAPAYASDNAPSEVGVGAGSASVGHALQVTATVADDSAGCTNSGLFCDTPTGVVEFSLSGSGGSQNLGSVGLAASNGWSAHAARSAVVTLPAGTYTLLAHYLGSNVFNPNHDTRAVTITKSDVNLTFTQSTSKTASGQAVTLVARIGPIASAGSPKISGTVAFFDDGKAIGPSVAVTSDALGREAARSTTALHIGNNALTAHYSGDANYVDRTSIVLQHNVNITLKKCALLLNCGGSGSASTAPASGQGKAQGKAAGSSGIGTQGPTDKAASSDGATDGTQPAGSDPADQDTADPGLADADTGSSAHGTAAGGLQLLWIVVAFILIAIAVALWRLLAARHWRLQ